MKTLQKKFLSFSLIFSLVFLATGIFSGGIEITHAKSERFPFFSDVAPTHKNFSAITNLQKDGIVGGYADGTFKPDQAVSRAEALKILLLGSGIQSAKNISSDPFPDVEKNEWFAGYVQVAKGRKIVNGRGDGNFVPSDRVNTAEALKMMLLVNGTHGKTPSQNPYADIPKDSWFAGYFSQAQEWRIFDTKSSEKIFPAKNLTRGELVEMMYRLDLYTKGHTKEKLQKILYGEKNRKNFTGETPQTIEKNNWENITLEKSFIPLFRKNEIFVIHGSASADVVTGIISFGNGQKKSIQATVKNGKFSLPLFFDMTGNIEIGIIAGKSGQTFTYPAKVLENTETIREKKSVASAPKNISVETNNGSLQISWEKNGNTYFHIYLLQNGVTQEFWSNENSINIPNTLFKKFSRGNIFFAVQGNISGNTSLEMQKLWSEYGFAVKPVYKGFPIADDGIVIQHFSWEYDNTISLTADLVKNIPGAKLYVMDGNENLYEKSLTQDEKNISFTFTPKNKDFFLIEITNSAGLALAVLPASPKGFSPVIPLKRSEEVKNSDTISDVYTRIKSFRAEKNRSTLKKNIAIEELAQVRAEDMKSRNYFSHTTPNGKTVNDFRSDFGITVPLYENIAVSTDGSLDAAKNLEFSLTHRNTLLEKKITQMGVGVVKKDDGTSIVVELFGDKEISEDDIQGYKKEIETDLLKKFSNLQKDEILEQAAQKWSNIMAEKNNAQLEFSSGESWKKILDEFKILRNSNIFIGSYQSEDIIHSISNKENLLPGNKTGLGVGIALSDEGVVFVTVLSTG